MSAVHGQPPTSNLIKSTDNHFVSLCAMSFFTHSNQGVLLLPLKSMQEVWENLKQPLIHVIFINNTFQIVRIESFNYLQCNSNIPILCIHVLYKRTCIFHTHVCQYAHICLFIKVVL